MIDAPVVWVAPATAGASAAPSADAEALLARFAATRGLRLGPPGDGGSVTLAVDPRVVADVESALLAGRDALARLDGDAIERAAAHALTVLHAHPELPQAAWLAAEAHRLLAARFHRAEPRDEARAEREWASAATLDGGRASALGEPDAATTPARVDVPTALHGVGVSLAIDGARVEGTQVSLALGEHHALLRRGDRTIAATWLGVRDATPLVFEPPSPPACSREDLAAAALDPAGGAGAPGARCPTWVAADASAKDVLRVAVCEAGACEPFVELRSRDARVTTPPPPGKPFPVWIPITAGIVVAAATTLLSLWAAGVFDAPATVVRFTQGNVEPSGKLP